MKNFVKRYSDNPGAKVAQLKEWLKIKVFRGSVEA